MTDIAIGGFAGRILVGEYYIGSIYYFICIWTRSGSGILGGVASETVRVRKAVGTDIRECIDISKFISVNKIDKTGTGVAAYAEVVVAKILIQRNVGASGLPIDHYSRQAACVAVSGISPSLALFPAECGVMWIVAIAAVQFVAAGDIIGPQSGTEMGKSGCAAQRNAVGYDRRIVTIVLTGTRVDLVMALGALAVAVRIVGRVFGLSGDGVAFAAGGGG